MADTRGRGASHATDPAYELAHQWQAGRAPDVHEYLARAGDPSVRQLVAVLRVDQQQRWQRGERVPAEAYFERYPVLQREADHGLDLVYEEFLLRDQQGGKPQLEEYGRRFPQYADALRRQLEVYRAVQAGA